MPQFVTALISFLPNSINTRLLSSYLKANGCEAICVFCPDTIDDIRTDALVALLKSRGVMLAGISLVTDDYHRAVALTSAIRQRLGIPVIWGGAHPNVMPEECLAHADMICLGEGEEALLELVRSRTSGRGDDTSIRNIWFKRNGGVIRNELRPLEEDLDKYPFPDFDTASQFIVTAQGIEQLNAGHLRQEYSIMTSRGCPYSCHYCYNSYRRKHFEGKGRYLRFRSVENAVAELAAARRLFPDLKKINFWDDSFVARPVEDFRRFESLYREKVGLPFFALVEPMAFHFEKMKILRAAGLSALQVGIQSGSERVNRDVYNRPVTNAKVLDVANFIKTLGIATTYDIIFNNPYETRDDIIASIRFLMKFPRPLWLQGYNLIFYPGTEISRRAIQDGYITADSPLDKNARIQGVENSPIATSGAGVISSRFYRTLYDSSAKEYLYLLFPLLCFNHMPRAVISWFITHESEFTKRLLKKLIGFYLLMTRVKARLA